MNDARLRSSRANYGIDAPGLVLRFAVIGAIGLIFGGAILFASKTWLPFWLQFAAPPAITCGIWFLAAALVMLWGSKVGKLRLRDKVIDSSAWRGDEVVLDVGCGHGLMVIAAAKRLRTGKAIGIDLWQAEDQAGNSRGATRQNVDVEGVQDRVELIDGDARALPFPDHHFDVVLSSWALHNIYDRTGRERAIQEICRVLKPGGQLAIIDIRHTSEYAAVMQSSGLREIRRSRPNFLFFIPSNVLTATKSQ